MNKIGLLLSLLPFQGAVVSFSLVPYFLSFTSNDKRLLTTITFLRSNQDEYEESSDDTRPRGIPQLPATLSSLATAANHTATTFVASSVVGPKLQLQYTCQICDTRNVHQVSRIAYRQGIVIARCRGCSNQHLIADHHGGGFRNSSSSSNATQTNSSPHSNQQEDENSTMIIKDIETYLQQQGKEVHRVSQQVFDLEQVWSVDTSSGSLLGENGERNME